MVSKHFPRSLTYLEVVEDVGAVSVGVGGAVLDPHRQAGVEPRRGRGQRGGRGHAGDKGEAREDSKWRLHCHCHWNASP